MASIPIPIVITSAGAQPADPVVLQANLIANAQTYAPGLTADLPGTLIEDVSSTGVGAVALSDQAFVDAINSISPTNSNTFILNQQGQLFGIPQGIGSNGSVFVVITGSGLAGFVIPQGFTVTDGANQYVVQDGGVLETGGQSAPLFCIAIQPGSFAIPANSVNALVTSVPTGYTITCTNPTAGLPASAPQTTPQYRAQVLQAFQAPALGMPAFTKGQIQRVSGVQPQLVSMQQNGSNWIIVVGGGDPYAVAYAIFTGVFDILDLTGCDLTVANITQANPGVVFTTFAHGFATGAVITMEGVTGMVAVNGVPYTITVESPYAFSIGVNTSGFGAYISGGVITPNPRNQRVSINNYPDTYQIPFVVPLAEATQVGVVWNTIAPNFTAAGSVAGLAVPAIVAYVNSIPTGQPINILELQSVFQQAVVSILATALISELSFAVVINGIGVSPEMGTEIIPGDAFSYFQTSSGQVTVTQG